MELLFATHDATQLAALTGSYRVDPSETRREPQPRQRGVAWRAQDRRLRNPTRQFVMLAVLIADLRREPWSSVNPGGGTGVRVQETAARSPWDVLPDSWLSFRERVA